MSETKIIDKIQIDDIEASILGATISSGNGDGVSFGESNTAGKLSFATNKSTANGDYSHAEGFETEATGDYAHAEGYQTISEDIATHAEGYGTQATGIYSHTEGCETVTNGTASHAEGQKTTAGGMASHAEGYGTNANSNYSHAEGQSTLTDGDASHAEGYLTKASGNHSHAEGDQTNANGNSSHAEGENTLAEGEGAHAEGEATYAGGSYSHAEGDETKTYGLASHAEGSGTTAYGDDAHAEGANTKAGGEASHTEGYNTRTSELGYLITEYDITDVDNKEITVILTDAHGITSQHIPRFDTNNETLNSVLFDILSIDDNELVLTVNGSSDWDRIKNITFEDLTRHFIYIQDHPELGNILRNSGKYAHAEGNSTQALGEASHSEGKDTQATGNYSHASGLGTIASEEAQTVIGKYNAEDPEAVFIIGNGKSETNEKTGETIITRNNLFTIKTDGTVYAGTKNLTNPTKDNTIQNFKVSSNFINGTTVTRDETTTFIYNYENDAGDTLFQYLNPPLSNIYDISDTKPGNTAPTILSSHYQYLTTERWCGKPVYTSIIKISPYNSDSRIKFKFDCANCIIIRENSLSIKKTGEFSYSHPLITAGGNTGLTFYFKIDNASKGSNDKALCSIRAQNSGFYLNDAVKDYYIIAQIWYVKEIPEAIISSSTATS